MVEIRFKPTDIGTVPDGYVTTTKLADDAVTKPKVADAAVGNAELENDAVTREKILDGEVIETKVPIKTFIKCGPLSGNRKVLGFGYDNTTDEVILDREETPP